MSGNFLNYIQAVRTNNVLNFDFYLKLLFHSVEIFGNDKILTISFDIIVKILAAKKKKRKVLKSNQQNTFLFSQKKRYKHLKRAFLKHLLTFHQSLEAWFFFVLRKLENLRPFKY